MDVDFFLPRNKPILFCFWYGVFIGESSAKTGPFVPNRPFVSI
jgi:hypothetical protein